MGTAKAVRWARASSGLPPKWRHEQLSAAMVWERLRDDLPATRDLVTRLVGTSHGWGRHEFPLVGTELVLDGSGLESARSLFDNAAWEEVIERTARYWGEWGCAYLEALLRAADVTVSRSGS
jgi:CRISPR-associated endonuclease/helicase Cas3